jgi:flagellar hook-associated protein 2
VEDPLASPITFGGLASGLDTKAIIAALVGVEGQKVTLLQNQQSAFKDKVSAFDSLLGKLNALQTALGKIADPNQFLAFAAHVSSGGDSFFTATPQGSARAGTYQIAVSAIAQSTFLRSAGAADANASLGLSGDLVLHVGTTDTTIAVDATNDSLFGVRDAINKSGAAVDATVVFDGTQYHLELRGRDTGLANAASVTSEPTAAAGGTALGLTQLRAASDAAFTVDGQSYTSASNTVNGAIEGVSLQLLEGQVTGASPIQLSITESVDKIQQQISDFVSAYNSVVSYMNDQSAPRTASTDPIKPLSGESALSSLRLAFGSVLSSATDFTTRYTTLSSIGIASQNDGTLAFDTTKFQDAIGKDVDGVRSLLTDATQGLGKKMLDAVKLRTDPAVGLFQSRENALNEQISGLDKRIRLQQDDLSRYEDSLVQKFAAYETLIGQLKAQGDSLTALTGLFTSANGSTSNLGSQGSG